MKWILDWKESARVTFAHSLYSVKNLKSFESSGSWISDGLQVRWIKIKYIRKIFTVYDTIDTPMSMLGLKNKILF
jgi:hypothetical protein